MALRQESVLVSIKSEDQALRVVLYKMQLIFSVHDDGLLLLSEHVARRWSVALRLRLCFFYSF